MFFSAFMNFKNINNSKDALFILNMLISQASYIFLDFFTYLL